MLFANGKIFGHRKIKSGRKSSIKKKIRKKNKQREKGPKKRERVPFCCEVRDANKICK